MKKNIITKRSQLSIVNCALSIAAAMLLLCACQQADELDTGASPAITINVPAPPAWKAEADTRQNIDPTTGKVSWDAYDILRGTITFYHKSGLVSDPVPFTLTLASYGTGLTIAGATWPVGQDITHATLEGLYGYKADGTTRETGGRYGIAVPIYHATGTAEYGKPFNISFTHRTAQVEVKNVSMTSFPYPQIEVGGEIHTISTGGIIIHPILPADATQVTGTLKNVPFTIPAGIGGPLGKMYTVTVGDAPGTTMPDALRKIEAATADFVAWAQAYNASPTTAEPNYTLKYHIDLSAISNWTRIGTSSSKAYTGIFDGAGYSIKGLTISASSSGQGLFGYTNGATLANVTIVNPQVTNTTSGTGALVGYANGATTISNCRVEGGNVTGAFDHTGGLAGNIDGTTHVVNCYVNATVSTNKAAIGGLIGAVDTRNCHIVACHSAGTVTATGTDYRHIGGLVGYNSGFIRFCYTTAAGAATGTSGTVCAGGLVGSSDINTSSCYATGDVTVAADASKTGSLAGAGSSLTYCNASGKATGDKLVGSGSFGTSNTAHTDPADIKATLQNDAVTALTGIRMYDSATKQVLTYTFTKAIWKDDLTLDMSTATKE